jgi:CO/xanthine dehydrogenase FAD-binding subunit
MHTITSYHRPASLEAALDLLDDIGPGALIIAGGTAATTADPPPDAQVIDLQQAGLDLITVNSDRVSYGAMARIQDLIDHPATPPLVRDLAHREGPNTLRNAATIGGTIATADPESELLAALLVHETAVTIATRAGLTTSPIEDVLATRPTGIITSVEVVSGGETASARTGRTPADRPIVAAAARSTERGTRLALTGVAATPVLVAADRIAALTPPGDFRGSPEYRMALARTLTGRVLAALGGTA